MKPCVGVLLNQSVLQKAVRGKRTMERLELYTQAARELDVEIVFFAPAGVRFKERQVVGYVPTRSDSLKRARVPLPEVVHKRGLFYRRRDSRIVKQLIRRGVHVFNRPMPWDKYTIHLILAEEPLLSPHLPETVLPQRHQFSWFAHHLKSGAEIFVKPRRGSLGLGIARVWRDARGRYHYQSRAIHKITTLQGAWHLVRRRRHSCFLQKGIPLMKDKGRRIDFRVPVQKDGTNQWNVPGIVAKRAERVSFLTNLARGGSSHVGQQILARKFGLFRSFDILDDMEKVATLVAQTINDRCPQMVDLGLDIGVDADGHVYVIEVNRRDLRITLQQSGQRDAFAKAYENPIAYARYLLQRQRYLSTQPVPITLR